MQDEVNEKTIALYIKTGKLTAPDAPKGNESHTVKGQKAACKTATGQAELKAAYEAERGRFQH